MNLNAYESPYSFRNKLNNTLLKIPEQKEGSEFNHISIEDVDEEKQLSKRKPIFRMPEPKRYIGLHSFSRRLYKDVPDIFDVLKKLVLKIQYYVDRVNPEVDILC